MNNYVIINVTNELFYSYLYIKYSIDLYRKYF